jgi:hypothetical protein
LQQQQPQQLRSHSHLACALPLLLLLHSAHAHSLVEIAKSSSEDSSSSKTMAWPLGYTMPNGQRRGDSPGSSSAGVELEERPGSVIAVLKFSDPTTEQFVRYLYDTAYRFTETTLYICSVRLDCSVQ